MAEGMAECQIANLLVVGLMKKVRQAWLADCSGEPAQSSSLKWQSPKWQCCWKMEVWFVTRALCFLQSHQTKGSKSDPPSIELLFTMKLEIATSTQPPSPPLCTAISEPEEERNNDTFDVAHLLWAVTGSGHCSIKTQLNELRNRSLKNPTSSNDLAAKETSRPRHSRLALL